MDVISLKDTQLVKGSHGRLDRRSRTTALWSLRPSPRFRRRTDDPIEATAFKQLVLDHVFS